MRRNIINILITLVVGLIVFYFTLPAINLSNIGFYVFVAFILIVYGVLDLLTSIGKAFFKRNISAFPKRVGFIFLGVILVFPLILVINLLFSPVFNAKSYSNRITIEENGDFAKDIKEVDFSKLPLLDKQSSMALGDRVMGEVSDLVSQYRVSDFYTQINYNDKIVRVTPLEYADIIKYFTNRKKGIVGYIMVDSTTGKSNLIRLDKGMKYSPAALFNENLERKLRFSYPFENFGDISFEVDNEGNPYYIVPTIKYSAVGLKPRVSGVIIFNPIDGSSKKYLLEEIPTWVDIAYSASLIIEQVDDWGTYKNGFFNSIFGQKNVVNTTDGYNYLAMDDDIYLYTGITSVVSDESNLGFILSNMRTGKTTYYNVPGAEEYSAMASAEGQVQDMRYKSTFPLLINLNNKPTYLVSLKDSNGLVKMYGFVDVKDYQKVVVTDSSLGILKAKDNYLKSRKIDIKNEELTIESIKIDSISSAIINGNTNYYVISNNKKYKLSITLSDNLAFMRVGDTLKVGYYKIDEDVIEVEKIIE